MKHLKNYKLFEYTRSDEMKDYQRIETMINKAKDDEHLLRMATTMAKRIKNYEKAYNRGLAAEDVNYHDVAEIFFNRAKELE